MEIAQGFDGQHEPMLTISIDDVYQQIIKRAAIGVGDEPEMEARLDRVLADDATFAYISAKAAEIEWVVTSLVLAECQSDTMPTAAATYRATVAPLTPGHTIAIA